MAQALIAAKPVSRQRGARVSPWLTSPLSGYSTGMRPIDCRFTLPGPFVYLAHDVERDAFKIGCTGHWDRRQPQLGGKGRRRMVQGLVIFHGGFHYEKRLHAALASWSIGGEWYQRAPLFMELMHRLSPSVACPYCREREGEKFVLIAELEAPIAIATALPVAELEAPLLPLSEIRDAATRSYLKQVLAHTGGNNSAAARHLRIARSNLIELRRRLAV